MKDVPGSGLTRIQDSTSPSVPCFEYLQMSIKNISSLSRGAITSDFHCREITLLELPVLVSVGYLFDFMRDVYQNYNVALHMIPIVLIGTAIKVVFARPGR